jgi:fructokinase
VQKLVGIGEILWDMLPGGCQLGGAPANFAYHAHALGMCGAVVSRVGADRLGREVFDKLDALGVDWGCLQTDEGHPTGTVTVTLAPGGAPDYDIHEGVAWDYLEWNEQLAGLAHEATAVCFGTLASRGYRTRQTVVKFLEACPKNCLKVFDINLRQSYFTVEMIRDYLRRADVVKLNHEELPTVFDLFGLTFGSDSEALRTLVQKYGLKLVVLTCGGNGSMLCNGLKVSNHDGFEPETMMDTVGAGDSFTAAVICGILKGWDLDQINDAANRLASFVCSKSGATPVLPYEIRSLFV